MKTIATVGILIALVASTTYYISAGGCCGGGVVPEPEKEEVKVEEKKACCSGKAAEDVKACCKGKLTTVKKANAGHACCAGKDADKVKKCCDGKLIAAPKADFTHGSWLENMDTAKDLASKTGKQIMAVFSGSDWCTYCIKLEDEILSKNAFKNFASDSLILVELDFPREKAQSSKLKAANIKLAEKYGVTGYPTVLLLKADGSVIARTGYRNSSASEYVNHLKELLK